MNGWEMAALVAGGAFTARVVYFAGVRAPRWLTMEPPAFLRDFARTIRTADKVQPALLVVTIASLGMVNRSVDGTPGALALAAAAGFAATMVASVAVLVPLQRRMIRDGLDPSVPILEMRSRWVRGHVGRTVLSVISFGLLALAVAGAA